MVDLGVRESWKEIYKQKVRCMICMGDEVEGIGIERTGIAVMIWTSIREITASNIGDF